MLHSLCHRPGSSFGVQMELSLSFSLHVVQRAFQSPSQDLQKEGLSSCCTRLKNFIFQNQGRLERQEKLWGCGSKHMGKETGSSSQSWLTCWPKSQKTSGTQINSKLPTEAVNVFLQTSQICHQQDHEMGCTSLTIQISMSGMCVKVKGEKQIHRIAV